MLATLALLLAVAAVLLPRPAEAHGRLLEPPSRSSMWRFGFRTKPNYNDNELFCGGWAVQWQRNGGKCGICGDPWHQKEPRDNEAGGKYGKGIIVRHYKPGQKISVRVQLTANHRGYFEFRLCPNNNPEVEATQECLNQNLLEMADGSGTRYYPGPSGRKSSDHTLEVLLPKKLTCTQCVFQWTYTAGNNWGKCPDGKGRVGCGPQETFRGCSDVQIGGEGGGDDGGENDIEPGKRPKPSSTTTPKYNTTTQRWTTTSRPKWTKSTTVRPKWTHSTTVRTKWTHGTTVRTKWTHGTTIRTKWTHGTTNPPKWTQYPTKWWWNRSTSRRPSWSQPTTPTSRPPTQATKQWSKPLPTTEKPVRNITVTWWKPSKSSTWKAFSSTVKPWQTKPWDDRKEPTTPKTHKPPRVTPKPTSKPRTTKTPWVDINDIDDDKETKPCQSRLTWGKMKGMNDWCKTNCARGFCPASHCVCY
ncbi:hypothetical protein LAZ67_11000076 [Cordylochernes scorpioides]|uniref:Chitin-binding type-4 domain-containing protein n=1 Tax=Cordylochernes scorpioides TaxID=51811 RepID=A0ABY6L1F5_9ARAC|nr:hypothetical protein LAZ67_11000076 [Cordylochernes scorpioides]